MKLIVSSEAELLKCKNNLDFGDFVGHMFGIYYQGQNMDLFYVAMQAIHCYICIIYFTLKVMLEHIAHTYSWVAIPLRVHETFRSKIIILCLLFLFSVISLSYLSSKYLDEYKIHTCVI